MLNWMPSNYCALPRNVVSKNKTVEWLLEFVFWHNRHTRLRGARGNSKHTSRKHGENLWPQISWWHASHRTRDLASLLALQRSSSWFEIKPSSSSSSIIFQNNHLVWYFVNWRRQVVGWFTVSLLSFKTDASFYLRNICDTIWIIWEKSLGNERLGS